MSFTSGGTKYWVIMENGAPKRVTGGYSSTTFSTGSVSTDWEEVTSNSIKNPNRWTSDQFLSGSSGL